MERRERWDTWRAPRLSPAAWPALGGVACVCPQVFSQHPYAEKFIGKPHVWTVDYNNSEEFEAAIQAIMRTQVRLRASWDTTSPCCGPSL